MDALHLVILNLILSKNQKFHDVETSIIPLIKKKLKYLTDNGTSAHVKLRKGFIKNVLSFFLKKTDVCILMEDHRA